MAALPAQFVNAAAVTLNDTTELNPHAQALFIGGAGNLKITTEGGQAVTFNGLVAGSTLYVKCKIVWSTGSTASNIVAMW